MKKNGLSKFVSDRTRSYILTLINRLDAMLQYHFFRFVSQDDDRKDHIIEIYPEVENWIESDDDLEIAEYPEQFDFFGKVKFLQSYDKIYFAEDFARYVFKDLVIDNGHNKKPFMEMIGHIYLLRQLLEHGKLKYKNVTLDKKIIAEKFDFKKSVYCLFMCLPDRFSNEIIQKVKRDCPHGKVNKCLNEAQNESKKAMREHVEKLKIDEITKERYEDIQKRQRCIESHAMLSFIKEYQFIGEYNLARCKGIIKEIARDVSKNKIDKMCFEEKVRIFEFILDINALFHRYFTIYENDAGKKKTPSRYLSNKISHSKLFFRRNGSVNYADDFRNNVQDILNFFDTLYREHMEVNPDYLKFVELSKEKAWVDYKHIKNHFLKAIKSLLNSKDWMYLVLDKQKREDHGRDRKIVRVGIPMPQGGIRISKKDIGLAVKEKVQKLHSNLNNRKDYVRVGKWKWLNLLRQSLQEELLKVKKLNQKSVKKINKSLKATKK